MTAPPWTAGQTLAASDLNQLVPQTATLASDTPSLGTTAAQAIVTLTDVATGTYRLSGFLDYAAANSAGAVTISIHASGSGAISSMRIRVWEANAGGTGPYGLYQGVLTVGAGTFTSETMAAGDTFRFTFDGIINVSAAGNFSVDLAQTNSSDGFTTKALSYARLEQVIT